MSVYFASFLVGKQDPYKYHFEPYERVANETTTRHMRSYFAYTHFRVCLFVFVFARLCTIIFFPIILILSVRIFHYTTRLSIRGMLANLYKRPTITTNALPLIRMACELLPNMLPICVFTSFRNMFLKFTKPREQPRMYTKTKECKAITMRPLRFVTEL